MPNPLSTKPTGQTTPGFGSGSGIGFWDLVPLPACVGIKFWVWVSVDKVLGLDGLGFGVASHEGIQGWDWDWV